MQTRALTVQMDLPGVIKGCTYTAPTVLLGKQHLTFPTKQSKLFKYFILIVNPRRMRTRVTVVVLCVCLSVCLSVCLLPH